jgi:hypothetical protein
MIYCSTVSYFGKVLFPAPSGSAPVPAPVPVPDSDLFRTVFQQEKILHKILSFQCHKQHCFPESLSLIFDFLTFVLHFVLNPGPNMVPEPECITFPVPLRRKVVVPVPATVPQHWFKLGSE